MGPYPISNLNSIPRVTGTYSLAIRAPRVVLQAVLKVLLRQGERLPDRWNFNARSAVDTFHAQCRHVRKALEVVCAALEADDDAVTVVCVPFCCLSLMNSTPQPTVSCRR